MEYLYHFHYCQNKHVIPSIKYHHSIKTSFPCNRLLIFRRLHVGITQNIERTGPQDFTHLLPPKLLVFIATRKRTPTEVTGAFIQIQEESPHPTVSTGKAFSILVLYYHLNTWEPTLLHTTEWTEPQHTKAWSWNLTHTHGEMMLQWSLISKDLLHVFGVTGTLGFWPLLIRTEFH